MSPVEKMQTGKEYWRSLDDLADSPEFREQVTQEFPNFADESMTASNRRQFLKVMGASLALAGLTSCRWPEEKIVPFATRPLGRKPGIPERFATVMDRRGVGFGLLVTSYDGRPIKIEGNPLHPESRAAADIYAQAALLDLYDPDRSKQVLYRDGSQEVARTWDDFLAFARERFGRARTEQGKGIAVLSSATSSPSIRAARARIAEALPDLHWCEYEPFSYENQDNALTFDNQTYRPVVEYSKAKVIVCLDADPLMSDPSAVRHANDFAKGRRPDNGSMNRLYVFESSYTATGTMADHRYPVAASGMFQVAAHLAAEIQRQASGTVRSVLDGYPGLNRFQSHSESLSDLPAIAKDLVEHSGDCVVVAGPRQPREVHALVATLNAALGNVNKTVVYIDATDAAVARGPEGLKTLVKAIQKDEVDTLLILGGNPVFTAPSDLGFTAALDKVKNTIRLGEYDDETSMRSRWHLPEAHFLEAWGDARASDGTYSVVQPLIAPLYGGKTAIEVLETLIEDTPKSGYEIVQGTFKATFGESSFDKNWRRTLHDGIAEGSASPGSSLPSTSFAFLSESLKSVSVEVPVFHGDIFEVALIPDLCIQDGRHANNGWLQELPDPITKLTWDNAVLIGPSTAKALNLNKGDVVTIAAGDRTVDLPVFVLPGQAPNCITIPAGFGRTASGRVGTGVGFDVYGFRTSGLAASDFVEGATIRKTGDRYPLATTQDHYAIDTLGMEERARRSVTLVRDVNLKDLVEDPHLVESLGVHHPEGVQLFDDLKFEGHKWAMAVDLNVCTGCNACVTACQAENNIPIVGKEGVLRNREMHWIRVDRYFQGDSDNPKTVHQPLACVHCEKAPCEQVCPVAATVHSKEGLNVMVYNRCVGTRYCSNNCPYKVRRFNFFNYHKKMAEVQKMMYNPEVTIRARGVMEKCSYCTQRIEAVKIAAKNDHRPIRDGEIRTACQQTCPTQAIVFGDLSDPNSEVSRLHKTNRAYEMLGELLVQPRTRYLARLRNPNPEIGTASHESEPIHTS